MAERERRVKFGFIAKTELPSRIASGEFDAYDIIYTSDTHEQYIISNELVPVLIRGKVYCYSSVADAVTALNASSDTYVGQLVSIYNTTANKYVGYIVNKNVLNSYYVTPLWEHPEPIDYNELNNKPITNVSGTMANPVVINDLPVGTYNISGYMTCPDGNIISSVVGNIVIVGNDGVIRISNAEMVRYTIVNNAIVADRYITEQVLAEHNYATQSFVETKIAALDFITRAEAQAYIESTVEAMIDEKIDQAIDNKIGQIEQEDIFDLFTV